PDTHNALFELMEVTHQFVEADHTPTVKQMQKIEQQTGGDVVQLESEPQIQLAAKPPATVNVRKGRENLKKYGLDPKRSKPYSVREVALALEARQRELAGHIKKGDFSIEARNKIARWMAQEIKFEVARPEQSGAGWYGEKFQNAITKFGSVFPELTTDQNARDVFTMLVAVTSDGEKVFSNFALAAEYYSNYRDGKPITSKKGSNREASIGKNTKLINAMLKEWSVPELVGHLLAEDTVGNLKAEARRHGEKFSSAYNVDVKLPRAALIFGPKLGAFYANLMGAHGYLTMDRWWSRTFNRYRGELVSKPTKEGIDSYKQLINRPDMSDADVLMHIIQPYSNLADRKLKTQLAVLVGKSEPSKKAEKAAWHAKAKELAGANYEALLHEHNIERASNTLYKATYVELRDVPDNGGDRSFMLSAVAKAKANLSNAGIDVSVADIQAMLWYYEKRLYGELGARDSADVSYEEAATRVTETILDSPAGWTAQEIAERSEVSNENVQGAEQRTGEEPYLDSSISANLSAAFTHSNDPSVLPEVQRLTELSAQGDTQAAKELQLFTIEAVNKLLPKSVRATLTPAIGLYGGHVEPSVGVQVDFAPKDRHATLVALRHFSQQFFQEQFHVRQPASKGTKLGHIYEDGSFNNYVVSFELQNAIPNADLEALATDSGLFGFTITDGQLQTYFFGDAGDIKAIEEFKNAAAEAAQRLGKNLRGFRETTERFWAYGTGWGATNSYESIKGELPTLEKTSELTFNDDIPLQLASKPVMAEEKTSSFNSSLDTAQHSFDIEQLQFELEIAEIRRDDRLDIKAGRQAKALQKQIAKLKSQVAMLNSKKPELDGSIPEPVGGPVDRIISDSSQETLRQSTSRWLKEYIMPSGFRKLVGRKLIAEGYDIERGELANNGRRLEGTSSATVLYYAAKNALVTASVAINQYGLKMVNKNVVEDENQLGLEPILEPVAKLGKKYKRLWEAYIVVKRAERLMESDKENFILEDDIKAIKEFVESKPNLHMLFENTQKAYMEFNRSNLNLAVEAGYINNEDAFGGQFAGVFLEDGVIETVTQEDGTLFPLDMDLDSYIRDKYGDVEYDINERDGWYHDDYVPFNRLDEATGHQKGLGHAGKIGEVRKGVVGLKGGIGKIPVIENMVKNTSFLISGAMKTVAMQAVIKEFGNIDVTKLPEQGASMMLTDTYAKELADSLDIDIDSMGTAEKQRWMRLMQGVSPVGRDTVVVYENGRPTYYRVDNPDLLNAIKTIGPTQLKGFMKVLGFPTRLLSHTITRMPAFLVSNLIRELQNAFVVNEKGSINPIVSIGKGLKNFGQLVKGGPKIYTAAVNVNGQIKHIRTADGSKFLYKSDLQRHIVETYGRDASYTIKSEVAPVTDEMLSMMAGGFVSFNSYYNSAPEDVNKRLNRMGVKKSAIRRIVESPISGSVSAWNFYMRVAAATEHANRLTVRNDYIKQAKSKLTKEGIEEGHPDYVDRLQSITAEGNFRGLDVLNFSRRGAGMVADLLMATMPFINPRIQGLDRLYRGAKESPGVFLTKAAILTVASTALAAWNWEENEEEMDKLKEEDKDLWYHFFIDNGDGTKDHYRFPKGFEIGQITGTLPERIMEQFRTDQPEAVVDSFSRFMHVTFGLSVPQVVKPAIEVAANRDFFRQRPIMSYGQSKALPQTQMDAWTSKVLIDIAQSMPDSAPEWAKSPKKLEHLFKGYLGPMGGMVLEGSNDLYEMTGNAPDAPTKDLSQRYLIRNFLRSGSERSSRQINRFYTMLDETGRIAASLNHAKKVAQDKGLYQSIKMDNAEKIKVRKALNRLSKQMSGHTKRIKAVLIDPKMSGDKKFEEIQRLTKLKNALAKKATERYWDIFD
ncbi:MAG: hypothetical protein GY752_01230, partial [bacterium]|nr:hypothetical protein [bacterium]